MVQHVPPAALRAQISSLLRVWTMPADLARRTAEIMVDADLRGIDSHGISMLPTYEAKWQAGGLRLDARWRIAHDDGRAAVLVDGEAGLGHVTAADAMDLACDRASRFGIGVATVRNSHHFGAAGYYARQAAHRGLLGPVTTSAHTLSQTPVGGVDRRLGTNPIAFAAPRAGHEPFVLDMSTTVVAVNKVKAYALAGRDLPAPWVSDPGGTTIHDADEALDTIRNRQYGGLLPLGGHGTLTGGHKGYGLAMMVQILSCALSGAGLPGSGPPDDIGHLLLAIDPAAFGRPDDAAHYVDALVGLMHDSTRLDPDVPVLVAGEPEDIARAQRERSGVPLPPTLVTQLRDLCDRHGTPFLLVPA